MNASGKVTLPKKAPKCPNTEVATLNPYPYQKKARIAVGIWSPPLWREMDLVQAHFEAAVSQPNFDPRSDWGISDALQSKLDSPGAISQVDAPLSGYRLRPLTQLPLLNATPLDNIRPGTLVRFRGMVQDMLQPEFFVGVFREIREDGTKVELLCGIVVCVLVFLLCMFLSRAPVYG